MRLLMVLFLTVFAQALVYGQASQLSPIGSTLSSVTNSDDSYQSISITSVFPSGVRFGNTTYTSMYVGSNGYVTFGHGNSGYSPTGIQAYTRGPIIAAQYDDLDPGKGGDIYYNQNTSGNYVVATFVGVHPFSSSVGAGTASAGVSFQIILRKPVGYSSPNNLDFQIEIRYQDIGWAKSGNNSAWPTAGWSAGDRATYALLPYSATSNFISNESSSNINSSGIYQWDVIGGVVQSTPTVNQTKSATSIGGSTATSGGNVSSDGGLSVSSRGIVWNTSGTPTTSSNIGITTDGTTGTGSFSSNLTGLSAGTTYYVRAYAINSLGTSYGPQVSFTTLSVVPPTVVTNAVSTSSITNNSASASGSVSSNGGATVSGSGILCSTSSNPTSNSSGVSVEGSIEDASISGLLTSTRYYVRGFATNSAGTAYGTEQSFITDHLVSYISGANGTIGETTTQYVDNGGSGIAVTAVPDANYHFVNWSDGSTVNPRTDTNVTSSKNLTANFAINRLSFTSQASQTRAGQNIPFTVKIVDIYGNTMSNSDQDITIAIVSNGGGGTISGTLTISASGGVISSGNIWINKTGSYTLSASAGSLTGATSSSFSIIPAASVDYFTMHGIADPVEAGLTTSPTVTAYDEYDNIKYDYTGTVSFSSAESNSVPQDITEVFPAEYTFSLSDNGIKTFVNGIVLKITGERSVTVTGDSKTGTQSAIAVTPAPINYYELLANPDGSGDQQEVIAGVSFSVKVAVYDEFHNVKTNYNGEHDVLWSATATSSRSGMTRIIPANGEQSFTAGEATVSGFTFYNAHETPTIGVKDGPTASPGTSAPITVLNNDLNNFLVESGTSQQATVPFDITVTARDIYWNTCLDYVGSIRFKSSDDDLVNFPTGLQPFLGADQGVKTFTDGIEIGTTGAYWVRVGDSQFAYKSGQQRDIMVEPGPFSPSNSDFTVDAQTKIAGEDVVVTLLPYDSEGNILLSCQNLFVYLDGVNVGVPQNFGNEPGSEGIYIYHVPVTSTTASNIITAKLEDNSFDGSYTITVNPAPPSLAHTTIIASSGSISTDENSLLTIQLKDQFGNNRTTNDGEITLTTNLGGWSGNNGSQVTTAEYMEGTGSYNLVLFASYDNGSHGVGDALIGGSIVFDETEGPGVWSGDAWPANGPIIDNETVTIIEGLPDLATSDILAFTTTITTDESSTVTLQLKDYLGNLIQNSRGAVSLSATVGLLSDITDNNNGSYTATLTGDTRGTNGTGTSLITGVLSGSVSGNFADTDTEVEITEGLPDVANIEITTSTSTLTADESTTITIQLKDQFGNLIVNNRGMATLSVDLGVIDNGTDTPAATNITANYINSGTYTATFKMNGFGVGNANITGTFNENPIVDNAIVEVTPGAATHLSLYTEPSESATAIAGDVFSPQPVIHILDQWNNLVTYDNTTDVIASIGSGTSVLESTGLLTATASGGIVTFSGLNYKKAENITINFDSDPLMPATSAQFEVVHNTPNYLTITGSNTQIAGQSQIITITSYDEYGNQAFAYAGDKALTFSGSLSSPNPGTNPETSDKDGTDVDFGIPVTITFTNGVATSNMTLYNDENALITATDGIINADENKLAVDVDYTQPAYLFVTGSATQIAGEDQTITVTAYDEYNNIANNYDGTKTMKFGGANASPEPSTNPTVNDIDFGSDTQLVFSNGVATATLKLYQVETASIMATDQADGGITTPDGYKLDVVVSHAAFNYFAIIGESPSQEAGTAQSITIEAFDEYNNKATSYVGDQELVFTGANTAFDNSTEPTVAGTEFGESTTLAFANGETTASMVLYKVEAVDIVVTQGVVTTPENYDWSITVNHTTPDHFALSGNLTQVSGESQQVTITVYDEYENVATGYSGTSLTFSGAAVSPQPSTAPIIETTEFGTPVPVIFNNGITTASMTLYKVEIAELTATDNSINADDNKLSVVVTHAVPAYMAIAGINTQIAGTSNTIALRAYDAYNNLAVGYNGEKAITFSGANLSPEYAPDNAWAPTVNATEFGTSASFTFSEGVAVGLDMILYKEENALISAIDDNSGITTPSYIVDGEVTHKYKLPVEVRQAAPSYLAITGNSEQTAGIGQSITVTAYDAFNNVATNYTGSKNLLFGGANASPVPVAYPTVNSVIFGQVCELNFSDGIASSGMSLYKTETAEITVTDQSIDEGNHSLQVLVKPTVLKDFVVSNVTDPHNLGVWVSPTVEARDSYGNRKTNYAGTVTFSNTDMYSLNPDDYLFVSEDQGVHTFEEGVLFSEPGNWWLTALDLDDASKYGAQPNIVVRRAVTVTAIDQSKTYGKGPEYGEGVEYFELGTTSFTVTGIDYVDDNGIMVSPVVEGEITGVSLTSLGETKIADVSIYSNSPSLATFDEGVDPQFYNITYVDGTLTVNKRDLTLNNFLADTKTYDGTSVVTGTGFNDDRVNDDVLTFAYDASFSDKHEGLTKTVNYTNIAINSSDDSGNYNLITTNSGATADINVRAISVTAQTDSKVYDGNTVSVIQPLVDALQFGDVVTSTGIQTFEDELLGAGKILTPEGIVIDDGNNGDNYNITYVNDNAGEISVRPITITVTVNQTKVYGENDPLSYVYLVTSGSLATDDEFSGELSRASGETAGNYAIGKNTLTIVEGEIEKESNYSVTFVADDFVIDKRALTAATSVADKTYDGSAVTGEVTLGAISNLVDGEDLTITPSASNFIDANVEDGKATTISYSLVDGSGLAANYSMAALDVTGDINQRALTAATSIADKTYDGSAVTGGVILGIVSNLVDGEDLIVTPSASNFIDANVEDGKATTITYSLVDGSGLAANYSMAVLDVTGDINQRALAATTSVADKTYDGSAVTGDVTLGTVSNLVDGEDLVITLSASNFIDANAEDGKATTISYSLVDGSGLAANYSMAALDVTGDINQRALTAATTVADKIYDGSAVTGDVTLGTVSNLVDGEDLVITPSASNFDNANVEDGKATTITYSLVDGSGLAANYSMAALDVTGDINQRLLTLRNFASNNKEYDGTRDVVFAPAFQDNRIEGDFLVFSGTAEFDDKNVGTTHEVTYSGITITGGSDKDNYYLAEDGDGGITNSDVVISTRTLTLTASGISREYDGTDVATVTFTDNKLADDVFTLNYETATFEDKNVGEGKTVNITGVSLSGTDADNYSVAATGTTTATIELKMLTVSGAVAEDKVYDGSTDAIISGAVLEGILSGEDVSLAAATQGIFASAQVANDISVSTLMTLLGNDAANYVITQPVGLAADILPGSRDLTLSKGWNLISIPLIPSESLSLFEVLRPLVDAGRLEKVLDEKGNPIENLGGEIGWFDVIGDVLTTEGYQVKVSESTTLTVSGTPIALPLQIQLNPGWNLISFPVSIQQNAMDVLQELIVGGYLIKAMDEEGSPIEYILGDWFDYIFNFEPGKGYKVKVSEACTLTINDVQTKSTTIVHESLSSSYFKTVYEGNGFDHMNIQFMDLDYAGIQAGDEIGIFDGENCVGALAVDDYSMFNGAINIPVSANDGFSESANGFYSGNKFSIKLYREGTELDLHFETLNGTPDSFIKGATSVIKSAKIEMPDIKAGTGLMEVRCYPNPFTEYINIEVNAKVNTDLILDIYNMYGQRIRNLYQGTSSGLNSFRWDSRNDSGAAVKPGIYLIRLNGKPIGKVIKQ